MLRKSIDLCLKDIDMSKREAVIAHATYKTLDSDGDRSNRGMFDKSWKEQWNILRFFLNHKKDQAPGKPLKGWDDGEHAYTHVKLGTHTLGEDVLKMLDEQTIVAASFGYDPTKTKDIKGKGQDILEVVHFETSVLTHWGAHSDSGPVKVVKSLSDFPPMKLKQLTDAEQQMLSGLISGGMGSMMEMCDMAMNMDPQSDLYTVIMWWISRMSDMMGDMRANLRYGMKAASEMNAQVQKMEKFIRNTTASDDAIQLIQKSLSSILNKNSDTAITTDTSLVRCPKCAIKSLATPDELGRIKCAECDHVIKDGQQGASRNKDEFRRKLTLLKARMALAD